MARFTFDIVANKPQTSINLELHCRKNNKTRTKSSYNEQYIGSIEASSYEQYIELVKNRLRLGLKN